LKTLTIISRKSHLAQIQAETVGKRILKLFPSMEIKYIQKDTQGDIDLNTPLHKMPEIGVFTNDIRNELIQKNADLAVHSWKDLPVEMGEGTKISATIERADLRDILIFKKSSVSKNTVCIYTSLPKALPSKPKKIKFLDIRGNIATRIKKLVNSDVDGLVMAKAALDRIIIDDSAKFSKEKQEVIDLFKELNWMVLPLSENPSAPAQGALAIETRADDKEIFKILKKINNEEVFRSVEKERKILKEYGGGCHQKIGVSYQILEMGEVLNLKGETEEGIRLNKNSFYPKTKFTDESFSKIQSIYPENPENSSFFDRKNIKNSSKALKEIIHSGIYVSRSNALDNFSDIKDSNTIWTSGIKTWISLSSKGLWVNGTSDSLGEIESPPENIFKEIKWYKISHDAAPKGDKEIIPTYRLIKKELPEEIKNVTHFYWMSSSSFEYALEKYPEIKNKSHACGLGRTFEEISAIIPGKVYPYLKYQDWLEKIKQAK
jgi:hydroxymethylbilane synthase